MTRFQPYQILIHEVYREVVALREWNERETVCLVTASGRRQILMNCLMQPVRAGGVPGNPICFTDAEAVAEIEKRHAKPNKERNGSQPCNS